MNPSEGGEKSPSSRTVVVPARNGIYEEVIERLVSLGHLVHRLPDASSGPAGWSSALVAEYFHDADAFFGIFSDRPLTSEVFAAAPRLFLGVSPIIGTETIDVAAATDHGILIAHGAAPENFDGMAEAVVLLVLALCKRLAEKWAVMRAGGWRPPDAGRALRGSTIGLIGFGRVGQATARLLAPFGATLVATDPFVAQGRATPLGVELVALGSLLERSDVVVVLTTLDATTHHLIGRTELLRMRRGAYLVNVSRGACVDEGALVDALRDGHLGGAAIDTFEQEPPVADNPLRSMPQVIATGHDIGHSSELYRALIDLSIAQLVDGLAGREPTYVRNREVLGRWRERQSSEPGQRVRLASSKVEEEERS